MKRLKALVKVGIVGLLLTLAQPTSSQHNVQSSNILDKLSVRVNLENVTTPDSLAEALVTDGIPGGIAVSHYCGDFQRHSLSPSNSSLRGLLDAIVAADPQYLWEMHKGVVNLIPRNNEPLFLETNIFKLKISNVETPNEPLDQLLAVPEVSKRARLDLGSRAITGGPYGFTENGSKPERRKFSITANDITVREALILIARASGSVWILVKGECNR